MKGTLFENKTAASVLFSAFAAAISLFANGFGIYLTIRADIGVSPWDTLNLGVSHTLGILYGNASIMISFIVLIVDILLREPIGISMIIDALVVGKSVDFFNWLNPVSVPNNVLSSVLMILVGEVVIGYTQYTYMRASLGCGPRDTLLVGLKKRARRIPIGAVSIIMLCLVTFCGWLLGGKVGPGTLITAFSAGPIMQFCFYTVHFDAAGIRHQSIRESVKIFLSDGKKTIP